MCIRDSLVSDRAFGGADTLATSYTLKCAIDKIQEKDGKFDLIFCGKQAIDGDTAQVGPEIAEHMDCPQITYAVEAKVENDEVLVKRETGEGYEILAAKMPCVITVTKPSFNPVSYTHLDVYKRQLLDRALWRRQHLRKAARAS